MPTADHVFGKDMAPLTARIDMLQTLIEALGWGDRVHISDFEGTQSGPSRTYETLERLSHQHPDLRFAWVIGSDNLTESPRWYRFDALVARWPLIVMARPGHEAILEARKDEPWCFPGPQLPAISSTELRAAIRSEGDPSALRWLPDSVRIQAIQLYP